ncbi:hypothetical protein BC2230_10837 [Burkholderia cepacia]
MIDKRPIPLSYRRIGHFHPQTPAAQGFQASPPFHCSYEIDHFYSNSITLHKITQIE